MWYCGAFFSFWDMVWLSSVCKVCLGIIWIPCSAHIQRGCWWAFTSNRHGVNVKLGDKSSNKSFFILQVFGTLGGTGESAQCRAEEASKSGAVLRMVATIQAPHIAVSWLDEGDNVGLSTTRKYVEWAIHAIPRSRSCPDNACEGEAEEKRACGTGEYFY